MKKKSVKPTQHSLRSLRSFGMLAGSVALCIVSLAATLIAGGCSGTNGNGSNAASSASASATSGGKSLMTGRAVVTIQWPPKQQQSQARKQVGSKLIPEASNLVVVTLYRTVSNNTTIVGSGQATRSADGSTDGSSATIEIDNLPVDTLIAVASAYAASTNPSNPNNPGVALATGSVPLTTLDGQSVGFTLTMNSTIDHLSLSPLGLSVPVGQSESVTVTAWNGADQSTAAMVLLSADKVQWSVSNTTVANVGSASGVLTDAVTGVAAGSTTVTATDTESTKSAAAVVTVTAPPTPTPTPSPTPAPVTYTAVNIGYPSIDYQDNVAYLNYFGGPVFGIYGTALNNSGQVAWSWLNEAGNETHGFLYTPSNGWTDIGNLGNSTATYAYAINDSGSVVGSSLTSGGVRHAFLYTAGVMHDLGDLGGGISEAYGINARGQITGYSYTAGGSGVSKPHAFLYSNGVMQDLGTPAASSSCGYAINSSGQVTGWSDAATGIQYACIFSNGTVQNLGTLATDVGSTSVGVAINSEGQVIGETSAPNSFLAKNGTLVSLATLAGASYGSNGVSGSIPGPSFALGLNDLNVIVGQQVDFKGTVGQDSTPYPFVYANGVESPLSAVTTGLDVSQLQFAYSVNASGVILIAEGIGSDDSALYLLTPANVGSKSKPPVRVRPGGGVQSPSQVSVNRKSL